MTQPPTLAELFGLGSTPADAVPIKVSASLKDIATKAIGFPALPDFVGDAVGKRLREVLSASTSTMFKTAWAKRADIAKYADPKRFPPDLVNTVELLPHKMSWELKPTVEIIVNENPAKTVEFKLVLTLNIQAAQLRIQRGRLMSLGTGKSNVAAKLSALGIDVVDRKSGDFKLPGEITFGDGIPLQ